MDNNRNTINRIFQKLYSNISHRVGMGLLALLCLAGGSCSDDDLKGYVPDDNAIRIVQNDLLFEASGNSATVEVDADGSIAASVDAEWCDATVSGSVITVTAQPNSSFEGRTAMLTITAGAARRQLPVQQLGMVLDLPLVTDGHYSPLAGDEFAVTLHHSLPVDVSSPQAWIHPVLEGDKLKVTVDSNAGGHIRRGFVACACGELRDTLNIAQYDMMNDVVGTYYLMGYYGGTGGAPAATRFEIHMRNDSLFMHWPQENYSNSFIHIPIDKPACTLFIPSGFSLTDNSRTSTYGYFYDTEGILATSAGTGVNAYLYTPEGAEATAGILTMANWPGHKFGGFIIRSVSIVTTTLIQLADPVMVRVGPVGTVL